MAEQGVHAKFFKKAVLHAVKSRESGRAFYEDKDYIEIRVAGMNKEVFVAPVNDSHKARFREEWELYAKGEEQKGSGTPIRCWPQMTPAQVANLESHNIFFVEDMATLSDAGLAQLGPGARKMQEDARKFLSLAQSAADLGQMDELREQLAAKDAQIAKLNEQMAAVLARLDAPEAEAPKRRSKAAAEPAQQ